MCRGHNRDSINLELLYQIWGKTEFPYIKMKGILWKLEIKGFECIKVNHFWHLC